MSDLNVVLIIVGVLAYEGYALWSPKVDPITQVIRRWNRGSGGLVALLFGILMGHFFWAGRDKDDKD